MVTYKKRAGLEDRLRLQRESKIKIWRIEEEVEDLRKKKMKGTKLSNYHTTCDLPPLFFVSWFFYLAKLFCFLTNATESSRSSDLSTDVKEIHKSSVSSKVGNVSQNLGLLFLSSKRLLVALSHDITLEDVVIDRIKSMPFEQFFGDWWVVSQPISVLNLWGGFVIMLIWRRRCYDWL